MMESATISGNSLLVFFSTSHSASCPKKSPAGLEASRIPSIHHDSIPCLQFVDGGRVGCKIECSK
jgi:hypothetical protein